MARSVLELIFRSKKEGKAPEEMRDSLRGAKLAFTELNSAVALAERALGAVDNIFRDTVGELITYNKTILDASRATGTTIEDFSRLVQVADDFDISLGEVTGALELATKNGFAPSVESVADLADRLNGIADPTQRAAEAAKILGRNWASLDPLLRQSGATIRAAAAAVEDGLIVTEAEQAATEKLRLQIDILNDSWTALKNTVVQEVVPALTDEFTFINALVTQGFPFLNEAIRFGAAHMGEFSTQAVELSAFLATMGMAAFQAGEGLAAVPPALDPIAAKVTAIPSIWDKVFPDPATLAGKIADQIAFIEGGGPAIVAAMEHVQQGLAAGVIKPDEALPMLDDLQEAALAIPVAAGDMSAWDAANINASDFGGSISQAEVDIQAAKDLIDDIPRRIEIEISYIQGHHAPGGGAQHGASFTVGGPGTPDFGGPDNTMVAFPARTGERVDVSPQDGSGGGGGQTFYITIQGGGNLDPQDLVRALRQLAT